MHHILAIQWTPDSTIIFDVSLAALITAIAALIASVAAYKKAVRAGKDGCDDD